MYVLACWKKKTWTYLLRSNSHVTAAVTHIYKQINQIRHGVTKNTLASVALCEYSFLKSSLGENTFSKHMMMMMMMSWLMYLCFHILFFHLYRSATIYHTFSSQSDGLKLTLYSLAHIVTKVLLKGFRTMWQSPWYSRFTDKVFPALPTTSHGILQKTELAQLPSCNLKYGVSVMW